MHASGKQVTRAVTKKESYNIFIMLEKKIHRNTIFFSLGALFFVGGERELPHISVSSSKKE